MNIGANLADILAATFFVTIIYVLARPQSKAADMIKTFSDMLAAIVRAATDL